MSKKKLLFLSHRLPYPPNKGDKIRSYNFVKRLAEDFDVYIGTFIDDPADRENIGGLHDICKDFFVAELKPAIGKILSLRGLLTGEALTLPYFRSADLGAWVRKILREEKPDVAFIFSSSMAQYVIDDPNRPDRIVTDFVDVDSDKWLQYAKQEKGLFHWLYQREGKRLLDFERKTAAASQASLLVSEKEADLFRGLMNGQRCAVYGVENGIDADFFSPEHHFESVYDGENPVVTMTGAMDYKPNVDGAIWFADEILPLIRRQAPGTQFCIVGSSPTPAVQALGKRDGIHVTGRVPDVRPYIAQATAIVAPIRIARGIQNKVLEGMAMARPVITTSPAFEGIEAETGEELIVADTAEDFAKAALDVIEGRINPEIGVKARSRVAGQYSWQTKYDKLRSLLG
ncbi:TIGR03087 family PEP-CTERM/XrtA system glycosyltransferase [Aestuariispira ectoiniformans]|uniref:TIGR03087 family PEP-CTERM/XrtA system glycosyltransferase n=1 Tax=Aestuariispira ectoiniformans TaxID=2775080 RepID=UPI00223B6E01|nr:TIGR03087 family PEP-CTERM/XrtA system glycosyltransferase [Aestuariispira ectoiniformans]